MQFAHNDVDCCLTLQNVVCESNFRCEPMLRGDQHVGVCVGESTDQFDLVPFHSSSSVVSLFLGLSGYSLDIGGTVLSIST